MTAQIHSKDLSQSGSALAGKLIMWGEELLKAITAEVVKELTSILN